jgi:NAD(P)-dependent dehydrogenase (short-subunit alcohol dehydrogenase family)
MRIDLTGQVAIVTGAGAGLGRAHALLLAERGARVVVNDLGSNTDGRGGSGSAAEAVVREIQARGGQALANSASVTDWTQVQAMVAAAVSEWGRVDILVNNAGILRDKTFAKMCLDDFRAVVEVHLMGSVHCSKAVWELMRQQNYGRIVMTTSSSGLYGNFGQSNYGAAKLALVGFMQTLGLEGIKNNIHVNCLAPTAATRMLEGLMSKDMLERLEPRMVSPALLALIGKEAPNRTVLCAGAGAVERAYITLTRGIVAGYVDDAPEQILGRLNEISDRAGELVPETGSFQGAYELGKVGDRPADEQSA